MKRAPLEGLQLPVGSPCPLAEHQNRCSVADFLDGLVKAPPCLGAASAINPDVIAQPQAPTEDRDSFELAFVHDPDIVRDSG